jgi:hypothetical protein
MQLLSRCIVRIGHTLWLRHEDGSWQDVGHANAENILQWRKTFLPYVDLQTSFQKGCPGCKLALVDGPSSKYSRAFRQVKGTLPYREMVRRLSRPEGC